MALLSTALIIIAAIAAGLFIGYFITITYKWLVSKIKLKMAEYRAKKVVIADVDNLIQQSKNKVPMSSLTTITNGRRAEAIAALDENNKIIDKLEIAKDLNPSLDSEVKELLGKEKMVIIEE